LSPQLTTYPAWENPNTKPLKSSKPCKTLFIKTHHRFEIFYKDIKNKEELKEHQVSSN